MDADTTYWLHTIGQFCPWSGRPVAEVEDAASVDDHAGLAPEIIVYPQPADNVVYLRSVVRLQAIQLYDRIGRMARSYPPTAATLSLEGLAPGIYNLLAVLADGSPAKVLIEKR